MGLFRRRSKGRHAFGAAVTSIPSAPLRVAVPLAAAVPAPTEPEPLPVAAPAEASVLTSISELIASGEAWASDFEDVRARALPLAPAELPAIVTEAPAPTPSRVQLGFRDGTSASLDPDSEQAIALELLAQSLTRRD